MFKKLALTICVVPLLTSLAIAQEDRLATAIEAAGENASEMQHALDSVPDDQERGMKFLIENMPKHDLRSLTAEFLLENVDLAYRTWQASWEIQSAAVHFQIRRRRLDHRTP